MTGLRARLGAAPAAKPARTRTEVATPRVRNLLRDLLAEARGWVGAYDYLCEVAGVSPEDIFSPSWAQPRVVELIDGLPWDEVYAQLEELAPKRMAELPEFSSRVDVVLAMEGIAYEMRLGRLEPFDPERSALELDEEIPVGADDEQFSSVYEQYARGVAALNRRPADRLAAIRESVNAFEAAGRIIPGKPKALGGEVADALVSSPKPHRKALAATLKALYGYASTVPGARHGQHETVQIEHDEAAFVVRTAGAGIALIVGEFRAGKRP